MPNTFLYHRRKRLGLCVQCGARPADPLVLLCARCREDSRQRSVHWIATHLGLPLLTPRAPADAIHTGPNVLACCGHWHPITTLPFTAQCCGQTFFVEERDGLD